MNSIVSRLLIYGDLPRDSILASLAEICSEAKGKDCNKNDLRCRVYREVKRLLVLATEFGFDENPAWQND